MSEPNVIGESFQPEVFSKPENPDAPSFLNIHPEVRNLVYHHLFVHEHPLLIVGIEKPQLHRRVQDRNGNALVRAHNFYFPSELACMALSMAAIGQPGVVDYSPQDHELERVAPTAFNIFLSCKQIHREAVSVFYTQNTFVVTKEAKKAVHSTVECAHDNFAAYLVGGARWLNSLGTHLPLLKKVVIDLDTLCSTTCGADRFPSHTYDFAQIDDSVLDIGPLMNALWHAGYCADVSFIHPQGVAHDLHVRNHDMYQSGEPPDAAVLTDIVNCLLKDSSGLKKYRHTIGHVGVNRSEHKGFVIFKTTSVHNCETALWKYMQTEKTKYHSCLDTMRHFLVDQRLIIRWERRPSAAFPKLPDSIRYHIFEHFIIPPGGIKIDLEKRRIEPRSAINYLCTSRSIFGQFNERFAANTFVVDMSTHKTHTSFDEFYQLRRWLSSRIPGFSRSKTWLTRCHNNMTGLRFSLNVRLLMSWGLSDLRINAMYFVYATRHLNSIVGTSRKAQWPDVIGLEDRKGRDVEVHIALWRQDILEDEAVITLRVLRHNVWQALSWLVCQNPSARLAACPDIYMDGKGRIVEAYFVDSKELKQIPSLDKDHHFDDLMDLLASRDCDGLASAGKVLRWLTNLKNLSPVEDAERSMAFGDAF